MIADLPEAHRYRVCSSPDSKGNKVEIYVDGTRNGDPIKAGECRDVKGKKIEVVQTGGNNSLGTFDNLD